jgi:hypothetical protein
MVPFCVGNKTQKMRRADKRIPSIPLRPSRKTYLRQCVRLVAGRAVQSLRLEMDVLHEALALPALGQRLARSRLDNCVGRERENKST